MPRETIIRLVTFGLLTALAVGCDNPVALPEPTTLVVVPSEAQIVALGSVTLGAQVLDPAGRVIPDALVLWSSSNSVVATVSAEGEVQAVSVGTATITATHAALSANATVTVLQDSLDFVVSFNIEEQSITMSPFSFQSVTVTAFSRRGTQTFANVSFSSSDPSVAHMDCCFQVHSQSVGTTRITGTVAGGLSDFVDVTVQ